MSKTLERIKDLEIEFRDELGKLEKESNTLGSESDIQAKYKELYDKYLGSEAKLLDILKSLKDISSAEEKKSIGSAANKSKVKIEAELKDSQEQSIRKYLEKNLKNEIVDPTHPGKPISNKSRQHILTKTIEEVEDIFGRMGFDVEYSKEVDNAFNTFDTLNIPKDHPARDSWDTLWLEDGNLAIPHTSAMQHRILKNNDTPIRKIIIGKTFRNEATDASHEHTFTQVEGVYLDRTANMGEMLGILLNFFETFYEQKLDYKFTPDYFPFVEPGGQLAIRFQKKKGSEGATDIKSKYLEVLGCGMIHPEVLRQAGKDPEKVSGFAWGFGLERIAMIKYNISEIRYFYSGDLRFSRQF